MPLTRALLLLALLGAASAQNHYKINCECRQPSSENQYCDEWFCEQKAVQAACFPSGSYVTVRGAAAPVAVEDLRVGDVVLAASAGAPHAASWTPVVGFLHRDPQAEPAYVAVRYRRASGAEGEVTMSEAHLALAHEEAGGGGELKAVFASELRPGQALRVAEGPGETEEAVVVSVRAAAGRGGAFAPLTEAGTVVVDGAAASCYANYRRHGAAHAAMAPLRWHYAAAKALGAASREPREGVHPYAAAVDATAGAAARRLGIDAGAWFRP